MRLTNQEIALIKQFVKREDPNAVVYLFGSRTDNSAKGGDIDLMVLSDSIDLKSKTRILWGLYENIGLQKIDLLINSFNDDSPFVQLIKKEGVIL
jgi:predicted nucleotidyltransferase